MGGLPLRRKNIRIRSSCQGSIVSTCVCICVSFVCFMCCLCMYGTLLVLMYVLVCHLYVSCVVFVCMEHCYVLMYVFVCHLYVSCVVFVCMEHCYVLMYVFVCHLYVSCVVFVCMERLSLNVRKHNSLNTLEEVLSAGNYANILSFLEQDKSV